MPLFFNKWQRHIHEFHRTLGVSLGISLFMVISCLGCQSEPVPARKPNIIDANIAESTRTEWRLLWSDEFNSSTRTVIDPQKWRYDVGGHGWGNQQLEFNTDRDVNALQSGDGYLELIARKERFQGNEYTSARINTKALFDVQYGRVEARIQLPKGRGVWPAFWMLGSNFPNAVWPTCGEIDIMEYRGQRLRESTGAIHGPGYSGGESIGGLHQSSSDLSEAFHLYSVEWSAREIKWYVDDSLFLSIDPSMIPKSAEWPFDQPFFLILNVAIGGHYVGSPDESTIFPQTMLVDYVRVYQAASLSENPQ